MAYGGYGSGAGGARRPRRRYQPDQRTLIIVVIATAVIIILLLTKHLSRFEVIYFCVLIPSIILPEGVPSPDPNYQITFDQGTLSIAVPNPDTTTTTTTLPTTTQSRRVLMPRTVNFVSGPSRTADIAGTLVTGAHGPRRLCVLLVSGT